MSYIPSEDNETFSPHPSTPGSTHAPQVLPNSTAPPGGMVAKNRKTGAAGFRSDNARQELARLKAPANQLLARIGPRVASGGRNLPHHLAGVQVIFLQVLLASDRLAPGVRHLTDNWRDEYVGQLEFCPFATICLFYYLFLFSYLYALYLFQPCLGCVGRTSESWGLTQEER